MNNGETLPFELRLVRFASQSVLTLQYLGVSAKEFHETVADSKFPD